MAVGEFTTNADGVVMIEQADGTLREATDMEQALREGYGTASVPIEDFEQLLGKLEGSKMRQQRQKSVEGRRDVYSQGLASMMSNF